MEMSSIPFFNQEDFSPINYTLFQDPPADTTIDTKKRQRIDDQQEKPNHENWAFQSHHHNSNLESNLESESQGPFF